LQEQDCKSRITRAGLKEQDCKSKIEKEALLIKGWNVCPEGGKSSYAFS